MMIGGQGHKGYQYSWLTFLSKTKGTQPHTSAYTLFNNLRRRYAIGRERNTALRYMTIRVVGGEGDDYGAGYYTHANIRQAYPTTVSTRHTHL